MIVYWDEGGGFYDHVSPPIVAGNSDGVPDPADGALAVCKDWYIWRVQMDNIAILRFIQWNWGLPSLNARNAAPGPTVEMLDMFTF